MPKESPAQQRKVQRVMHEFKEGDLHSGGGNRTVKNPRQAIAIALREAGVPPKKPNAKH